jgi:PspAA-like protein
MIVRISGEGQYELPDEDAARLNELDNQAVAAVEAGNEPKFHELWKQMLDFVCEEKGRALDDDELVESDVILPPRDTSFEEAKSDFSGEGLIPD